MLHRAARAAMQEGCVLVLWLGGPVRHLAEDLQPLRPDPGFWE